MKTKYSLLVVLLLCLLLLTTACGSPSGPDAPYEDYPDMATLQGLDNEERLYECNIPEDILPTLSTEALVESIYLHPMLALYCDINSLPVESEYGSWIPVNVDYMEQSFNAVPELFRREDALTVLEKRCQAPNKTDILFPNAVLVGLCLELQERLSAGTPVITSDDWRQWSDDPPYDGYPKSFLGMENQAEKLAACNIPEDILAELSTEALVESIRRNPKLYVYLDLSQSNEETEYGLRSHIKMEELEQSFNAVPELFQREDALTVLEARCLAQKDEESSPANAVLVRLLLELRSRQESGK